MIIYEKFELANGLRVLVHQDRTTPMVALNICYDVGARDENPDKTGFAHLFEHLMFGGSKNIANYDLPLQNAGGENNAYTTNDITNYYLTVPKANIETGFWLESDRMLELAFSQKSLDVQKNVVIEEFKQRNLNQPYGDVWALLRKLVYEVHPYQWPTIGKKISHIENATLNDVKDFFFHHYAPNNAVMVVTGNITVEEVKELSEKWFADIPRRDVPKRKLPVEPEQLKYKEKTVFREVPNDAIYMAFHMVDRLHPDFYATDLISDILSNGNSSRLYQKLVQQKKIFSSIDAYISGDIDPGIFVFSGKPTDGIDLNEAQKHVEEEISLLINEKVDEYELEKLKNKFEANLIYSETNYLTKAQNLAALEIIQSADLINTQLEDYRKVTVDDIQRVAKGLFKQENCSVLYYRKKQ